MQNTGRVILGSIWDVLRWRWLYRYEAQEAYLGQKSGYVDHHKQLVMKVTESNPNILRMIENGQRQGGKPGRFAITEDRRLKKFDSVKGR